MTVWWLCDVNRCCGYPDNSYWIPCLNYHVYQFLPQAKSSPLMGRPPSLQEWVLPMLVPFINKNVI